MLPLIGRISHGVVHKKLHQLAFFFFFFFLIKWGLKWGGVVRDPIFT